VEDAAETARTAENKDLPLNFIMCVTSKNTRLRYLAASGHTSAVVVPKAKSGSLLAGCAEQSQIELVRAFDCEVFGRTLVLRQQLESKNAGKGKMQEHNPQYGTELNQQNLCTTAV
jgi:hypothetical protein